MQVETMMARRESALPRGDRYRAPVQTCEIALKGLLEKFQRGKIDERQYNLLRDNSSYAIKSDVRVFYAGELSLLQHKCVSIVGTREVSTAGRQRAVRLARELTQKDIVVASGLAKGVDTAALTSALDSGGRVVAVIGTPLDKAYPAENAPIQETIWRDHLLITPFATGERVFRSNFPKRNRVMAAISDATVIVEASDTSGTLHQAAECQRLGRWLFIMRSVVDDKALKWPASFLGKPKTAVLDSTTDILSALSQ